MNDRNRLFGSGLFKKTHWSLLRRLCCSSSSRAWYPRYQGVGVGKAMMSKALGLAAKSGKKAFWLDTLASNVPAQRFYEWLGFVFCGKQHWHAENTGWVDFYLYEQEIRGGKQNESDL